MLPVECVVRGYITGSGWKDYQATGRVSGVELPPGLRESEPLPEPIFTPSTKAEVATTRRSTSSGRRASSATAELMARVRDVSIELYRFAADHARERGVILADTKFEFGLDDDGELVLGDEVLTPDSSRFWPLDRYEPGARSRASTSSTSATGRPAAAGTRRRPRRRSPTTSSPARASATSRPTRRSPASRSTPGCARTAA